MKTTLSIAAAGLAGVAVCLAQPVEQPQAVPALRQILRPAAAAAVVTEIRPATNAPAAARTGDTIELSNGDSLRGIFQGWEPGQGARWQHDAISGPVVILADKIRRLRLQRPALRAPQQPKTRLHLLNGDRLSATLVSLDEREAVLETWYAGTLKVPRAAISNLTFFSQQGDLIYLGPTGLDGWVQSEPNRMIGALAIQVDGNVIMEERARAGERDQDKNEPGPWIFNNDAFETVRPGSLGRDFKLPKVSRVSFEIECMNYPALTLHLYSDAADKLSGMNSLSFTFSGRMIYFRRWTANSGTRQIGTVDHARFTPGTTTKVRVTVCTDLSQNMVALYLDDVLARKFSVAGQSENLGTALVLQQQGTASLKISNFTISHWNGVFEEATGTPASVKEDLLFLNNRDKISGQLLAIRNGKAEFQTTFSKVEVPVERIGYLMLAESKDAPRAAGRFARVQLSDASRLSLTVQSWNDQALAGDSPVLGTVQVKAGAVTVVQFE